MRLSTNLTKSNSSRSGFMASCEMRSDKTGELICTVHAPISVHGIMRGDHGKTMNQLQNRVIGWLATGN